MSAKKHEGNAPGGCAQLSTFNAQRSTLKDSHANSQPSTRDQQLWLSGVCFYFVSASSVLLFPRILFF
jgi:hypothetical protein